MRKTLTIALLAFLAVVVPCVGAAQDCQYHTFKIDFSTSTWLDPPTAPYDACLEVDKVVGTLNGTYRVCFNYGDFFSSDQIYGDGYTQVRGEKLYIWVFTRKGDIEGPAWGWLDEDSGLEVGFSKIVGGTGDYENTYGTLAFLPRYPNMGTVNLIEGFLCTPEE